MMSGAAHVLAALFFLVQLIQPEAACSAGFTTYNDVDAWYAGLQTDEGKHCLEGTENARISVENKQIILPAGMEAEAHYVDFIGGDAQTLGGLMQVIGTLKSTHCSFKNGKTTGGMWDSGAGGVLVGDPQAATQGALFDCTDCVFESNVAEGGTGGGLVVQFAAFQCVNCNFKANRAGLGGALMNSLGATTTLNSCVFDSNVADQEGGGGAILNQGTLIVSDDTRYVTDSDTVVEQDLMAILLGGLGFILLCCCCCIGGCVAVACCLCKTGNNAARAMPQQQPQQVQMNAALNQPPMYGNAAYNQPPAFGNAAPNQYNQPPAYGNAAPKQSPAYQV